MLERETILFTVKELNTYILAHNISDFRVQTLKENTLTLVGSFDLSYYHDIEIRLSGPERFSLYRDFYVDLSEPAPFTINFPENDTAALRFWDCGAGQPGEILFQGNLSLHIAHCSYWQEPNSENHA